MFGMVIAPALAKLSPGSSGEFFLKIGPRVVRFFQIVAGSTVLFGVLLAYVGISNGDFPGISWSTTWGVSITMGIAFGAAAFVVAELLAVPALNRVVKVIAGMQGGAQQGPPTELMKALARAKLTANAALGLLVLAFVFMITAGFY